MNKKCPKCRNDIRLVGSEYICRTCKKMYTQDEVKAFEKSEALKKSQTEAKPNNSNVLDDDFESILASINVVEDDVVTITSTGVTVGAKKPIAPKPVYKKTTTTASTGSSDFDDILNSISDDGSSVSTTNNTKTEAPEVLTSSGNAEFDALCDNIKDEEAQLDTTEFFNYLNTLIERIADANQTEFKYLGIVIAQNAPSGKNAEYSKLYKKFQTDVKVYNSKKRAEKECAEQKDKALSRVLDFYNSIEQSKYSNYEYDKITQDCKKTQEDIAQVEPTGSYSSTINELVNGFESRTNSKPTKAEKKKKRIIALSATAAGVTAVTAFFLIGMIPKISYKDNGYYYGSATFNADKLNAITYGSDRKALEVEGIRGIIFPFSYGMSNVEIPALVGDNVVTGIGEEAFKGTSITSVTLPDTIDYIAYGAFENCSNLAMVNTKNHNTESVSESTIPESCSTIHNYAFYNCSSLKSLDIKKTIDRIYGNSFDSSLKINYEGTSSDFASKYTGSAAATYGSITVTVLDYTKRTTIGTYTVNKNATGITPEVKPGYTLKGFYKTANSATTSNMAANGNGVFTESITSDTTLYAKYDANTYTVTLDNNNNTANTTATVTYDKVPTFTNPTKTGYTFNGWTDAYGNDFDTTKAWTSTSNSTKLVAKWSANKTKATLSGLKTTSVTVTFNYNYSGLSSTTTLSNGETLSYKTPSSRSGYVFAGWYKDSACTSKYDFSGSITADMTLYAKWDKISTDYTYDVIDVTNYTSSSSSYSTSTSKTKKRIYFYVPSGNTYIYFNYKNGSNGSSYKTKYDIYKVGSSNTYVTSGSTYSYYYAWQGVSVSEGVYYIEYYASSSYTTTFYMYFEDISKPTSTAKASINSDTAKTVDLTYGAITTIPKITNLPAGCTKFLGWYTEEEGGTQITDEYGFMKNTWVLDVATITLYPHYEETTYNISYYNESTYSFAAGEKFTSYKLSKPKDLPVPTRTGYDFAGWYTSNTTQNSATLVSTTANIGAISDIIILYPKWTPKTTSATLSGIKATSLTVTYNPNYIGGTKTYETLSNGQTLTYPSNPERVGYVFMGWYEDSACTTEYDFAGDITSNITLYAKWYKPTFDLTYYVINPLVYSYYSSNTVNYATSKTKSRVYFNVSKEGSYNLYYANYNNNSSCETAFTVYDSSDTSVVSGTTSRSTYSSKALNLKSGVYYIEFYASSTSTSNFYIKFSGFSTPTSTATAKISDTTYQIVTLTYGMINELSVPTKTGYTFAGYYTAEEGGTQIANQNGVIPGWAKEDATTTLYPHFTENEYTISYSTSNNTYTMPSEYITKFKVSDDKALPTPIKTGYKFGGWYDNSAYTGSRYFTTKDLPASNVTLYASFGTAYNITYANSSQYTLPANHLTTYSSALVEELPVATKTGYNTVGWKLSESDTTIYTDTKSFTSNVTLYPVFKVSSYSITYSNVESNYIAVTYDLNYDGSKSQTINVAYGNTVGTPTNPTREGYFFAGWYDDALCTKKHSFTGYLLENITLYAKWNALSNANSVVINPADYTSSSNVYHKDVKNTSSSYEYTYFIAPSTGTINLYYKNDSSTSSYYYSTYLFVYNVTTSTTLYSNDKVYSSSYNYVSMSLNDGDLVFIRTYKYNYDTGISFYFTNLNVPSITQRASEIDENGKINVTYDLNYTGAQTSKPVEYSNGSSITIPTNPTRSGYLFTGWYLDKNATTRYNFDENIYENVTLYAGWFSASSTLNVLSYNSSSNAYSQYNYAGNTYFVAPSSGTLTVYYRNSSTSTSYKSTISIYNVTKSSDIKSSGYVTSTTYASASGKVDAGDVLYISTSKYSSTAYCYFYFTGLSAQTSTAKAVGVKKLGTTVTLNYNYSGSVNNNVVASGTFEYPEIPTRSGYVFAGWYKESACTNLFDFSSTIEEDITLYAKWISHSGDGVFMPGSTIGSTQYPSKSSKKYYAFVPLVSGQVTIAANSGGYDTIGYLCDSSKAEITNNDNGNGDFNIVWTLNAGELYYIAPCGYSSSYSMTITITGGVVTDSATVVSYEEASLTYKTNASTVQTVIYGETTKLLVPTRTGYKISGYKIGSTTLTPTQAEAWLCNITADTTVEIVWTTA